MGKYAFFTFILYRALSVSVFISFCVSRRPLKTNDLRDRKTETKCVYLCLLCLPLIVRYLRETDRFYA